MTTIQKFEALKKLTPGLGSLIRNGHHQGDSSLLKRYQKIRREVEKIRPQWALIGL
jgi:hypothetical protein